MTYFLKYEHFDTSEDRLVFKPNINPFDYEIQQLILEAERNIGALARLGLKSHPLTPTILRNSLVRTAHFTTKIEQNKLEFKEVAQVYQNYKKNPLTIKQKAQIEVKNVFETYEFIYRLDPNKDISYQPPASNEVPRLMQAYFLGKGHAKTMFELIIRMEDGEIFHRLFDDILEASSSSIAKNITKLKDLGVIKPGDGRGEYIVCIVD